MVYRSQTLRCVLATVDICPTSTIDDAAVEMVQLAKHLGSLVLAEFNGIELHARPNTFPEHVAASYHEAMLKRERIVKSPQPESKERTIPISQMEIHDRKQTNDLLQSLTLRDQFAMAALAMLDDEERDGDVLAYRAYRIADAMIAEREKALMVKPS